jgi:hypothetical protein
MKGERERGERMSGVKKRYAFYQGGSKKEIEGLFISRILNGYRTKNAKINDRPHIKMCFFDLIVLPRIVCQ